MPSTIWQLRGSTKRVVECCVDRTAFKQHAITVVFGHETFLSEIYPDEAGARSRAMQVRDELLKSGAWTLVGHPAVGVSHLLTDDGVEKILGKDNGAHRDAKSLSRGVIHSAPDGRLR